MNNKELIQLTIKKVNNAIELFNTAAFECEYISDLLIKETVTGIQYRACRHEDAVGYVDGTSRCKPDRCPFDYMKTKEWLAKHESLHQRVLDGRKAKEGKTKTWEIEKD